MPVENEPVWHERQAPELLAPEAVEKVPAKHGKHSPLLEAPRLVEYVPATHAWHTALLLPPGALWKVPAWHATHALAPRPELNVPAEQGLQTVDWDPVENVPKPHRTQTSGDWKGTLVFTTRPAGQVMQATEPLDRHKLGRLPAQGGQARKIIGTYESPLEAYRLDISVVVRALE